MSDGSIDLGLRKLDAGAVSDSGSAGGPGPGQRRWTVGELLAWTKERFEREGIDSPRVDAEHLLARALGCTRMDLYLQHDRLLEPEDRGEFRDFVRRRLAREPVAYIEGVRGFHALDLDLGVDRRVLIPRPDTEHLVDWLLESVPAPPAPPMTFLDVGTGSGAIALALKRARPECRVIASDASEAALAVAADNARRTELELELVHSDLLDAVTPPEGGFDAVAANLPYIPSGDIQSLAPEVRDFEPRLALDGGPDGLDLVRRLIDQLARPGVLSKRAWVFFEIGVGQAEATMALFEAAGFTEVDARADYGGVQRVIRAGR